MLNRLLAWFEKPTSRRPSPSGNRLVLECLEERDCPSAAPVLEFSVIYGVEREITLVGQVSNLQSDYAYVTFSGAASAFTMTGSNGSFSVQVQADYLGVVEGVAYDTMTWASSAVVGVTLTSDAPVIVDYVAVWVRGNIWTISGSVVDESPAGMWIAFGGLPSLSSAWTTINADGTFWLTLEIEDGESGTAYAYTQDWWGLASDYAYTHISLGGGF